MYVGAVLLSLPIFVMLPEWLVTTSKTLRLFHDPTLVAISSAFFLSAMSLLWCDVELLWHAFTRVGNRWFRSRLDWLVWVAASVLTAWCIWQSLETVGAYRLLRGLRRILF